MALYRTDPRTRRVEREPLLGVRRHVPREIVSRHRDPRATSAGEEFIDVPPARRVQSDSGLLGCVSEYQRQELPGVTRIGRTSSHS
jgi:hypothetical protein